MTQACDHDFKAKAKVIHFGIFLPQWDELSLYCSTSKVTSDFMVDAFESWWLQNQHRFPGVVTLLFNQDNGPNKHVVSKDATTRDHERLVLKSEDSPSVL